MRLIQALIVLVTTVFAVADDSPEFKANAALTAKFQKIAWARANMDQVEAVLGAPQKYRWGDDILTRDKLPEAYIARYEQFAIEYCGGKVEEVRFEPPSNYKFRNIVGIGSSLDDLFAITGKPRATVEDRQGVFNQKKIVDMVLYKDRDGQQGSCYFECRAKGLRVFFSDYKISALYIRGAKMTQMIQDLNKVHKAAPAKKKEKDGNTPEPNVK